MKAIIFILSSLLIISPVFADTRAHDLKPIYHVYDDVDLIPKVSYQYAKTPRTSIKTVYPQLQADSDDDGISGFNQAVDDMVTEMITDFKKQILSLQDRQKNLPPSLQKNTLTIDYNASGITTNQQHILSVRFNIQAYIGGMAHPDHQYRVLNYNLDSGEKIELADLFSTDVDYLDVFAQYAQKQLSRHLPDNIMLKNGITPEESNYALWNLKPDGILFTFSEGQVAPAVYGAQTILIPYYAIKELFSTDSPLASCTKRKRCVAKNLLTGGFIDEA